MGQTGAGMVHLTNMTMEKETRRRRWREALIREYGKIMLKNPSSYVFVSMADTCLRAGMPRLALDTLEKGLRFHPGLASATVLKGRALMALGRWDDARLTLLQALENGAENVLARKLLARVFLETGEPERGVELLEEIRALWPKQGPPGRLYHDLKMAIEKSGSAGSPSAAGQGADAGEPGTIETLERWLKNANKMMVKG